MKGDRLGMYDLVDAISSHLSTDIEIKAKEVSNIKG